MKKEKDNLEKLFEVFQEKWDTENPELGHHERFMNRLKQQNNTKQGFNYKMLFSIAATLLLFVGMALFYQAKTSEAPDNLQALSPQMKETHRYFSSIIEKEIAKIEKENTAETKKIVDDALTQIKILEKDYENLAKDLAVKGENKQIIHAMITNLKTRISFLEEVLEKIENIKKLKSEIYESKSV